MQTKQVEFDLNFGGFYESIHGSIIDDSIADFYDKDINDIYDNDKIFYSINFDLMKKNYAKEWLNEYLKIVDNNNHFNIEFKEIVSPEYYNYQTDRIGSLISESIVNDLIKKSDYDLIRYINENSQSGIGYTSHYVGFEKVIKDKAVFMTYYTDYLTELNKNSIEYIWQGVYVDIELLEEK
tara:strand:+ start:183 stop:725 length:543 start_codon:yes stop_codon:yes gene_type:complete